MVYRGRSGACSTCKQRHVKCDQAKPHCRFCLRLGLVCGGYQVHSPKFKFRDQTVKFLGQTQSAPRRKRTTDPQHDVIPTSTPAPRPMIDLDTAVPFFLMHFADMGRDLGSTGGFFEMLIPVYRSQPQHSALSLTLSVVSLDMLGLWRHDTGRFQSSRKVYAQAIERLRVSLDDPAERGMPATMLAVLLLQFHERLAAVHGRRPVSFTHHDGAISLLPFAESGELNKMIHTYMQRHIVHNEVTMSIHQKKLPQPLVCSRLGETSSVTAPENPNSELDIICASVAELQANVLHFFTQGPTGHALSRGLKSYWAEAQLIEDQLLAWERGVPQDWRPLTLNAAHNFDASIPSYKSVCDIYPSCQIASIWNLWRLQRLLLNKIRLVYLCAPPEHTEIDSESDHITAYLSISTRPLNTLQGDVESICRSIPFYLGNRTGVSSLADFSDSTIVFPSLPPSNLPHNLSLDSTCMSQDVSRDKHQRHLIAQGPWHAMDPLSQLLLLLSEDHGQSLASMIERETKAWIQQQFVRVMILLGIRIEEFSLSAMCRSKQEFIHSTAKRIAQSS
jgi:hypothetical protein